MTTATSPGSVAPAERAGLLVGYARCSTDTQDLTAQRDALAGLGVAADRIYVDHGLTGTNRARPGLREALAAGRTGDTLVVTKLDRFARSLPDARDIVDELTQRGVKLNIGGSVHDPTDPIVRLLFNVLAMIAEFEADLARLRTREGMKVARAKGRLRGKQPKLKPSQEAHLIDLWRAGGHTSTSRRSLGHHGTRPAASSASAVIVASECSHTRRYRSTTSSRDSSAVAHMSALGSASSCNQGSTSSNGRWKQSPKYPTSTPAACLTSPSRFVPVGSAGGGCRTRRGPPASRAAHLERLVDSAAGPPSARTQSCPSACHPTYSRPTVSYVPRSSIVDRHAASASAARVAGANRYVRFSSSARRPDVVAHESSPAQPPRGSTLT
jgi:DNA invertase Pin-like site-specific DNA recombinase